MELNNTGQPRLNTRIAINALPDNVLLEIFDFYLDRLQWFCSVTVAVAGGGRAPRYEDLWHTLVHVCRSWRTVVFASPRRLNLQLLCTEKKPVKKDIWPELPITIRASIPKSRRGRSQGVNNIFSVLKQQHNRVCRMTIGNIPNSLLKKFAAIKAPFPALTHLALWPACESPPIILRSLLKGSAPRLQLLIFQGIPFLALDKLLLSSCDLFDLRLDKIPHSGYISPDALVSSLSGLTRLKHLTLVYQSPRSRAVRERRVPPSPTRVVLPALASFRFKGDSEYLEDMLSRMDTPPHVQVTITFFNQLAFDTPRLGNLINRAEAFKTHYRSEILFSNHNAVFTLFSENGQDKLKVLDLGISCGPSDWQLSSLAQVIGSSIPHLPSLERLQLRERHHQSQHWQYDIENSQWLELLRPFAFVKDLVLCGQLVRLVAPVLGELIGERVVEVLPALQNILVEGLLRSGSQPWEREIGQFITARQISGHPVAVHYPELGNMDMKSYIQCQS